MKIFDCFMYFDEDVVLDLRLNVLDKYVDYFVIVESVITHKGEKRELKFNNKKFQKFKDKIIYIVYDKIEKDLEIINADDIEETKTNKYIMNALRRENSQRNYIEKGISGADENDIILISDVDEIPNLENIKFRKIKEKIFMFRQDMFYYKFDLKLPNLVWVGTKGCRKKNLLTPQWLRNVKDKKYSKLRLDILFSDKKFNKIKFFDNGGWHFSNLKSAKEIKYKLKSYLHHREFDQNPLSISQIEEVIKKKEAIYDLTIDKRISKIGAGLKLLKYDFEKLPDYLKKNKNKYQQWLD